MKTLWNNQESSYTMKTCILSTSILSFAHFAFSQESLMHTVFVWNGVRIFLFLHTCSHFTHPHMSLHLWSSPSPAPTYLTRIHSSISHSTTIPPQHKMQCNIFCQLLSHQWSFTKLGAKDTSDLCKLLTRRAWIIYRYVCRYCLSYEREKKVLRTAINYRETQTAPALVRYITNKIQPGQMQNDEGTGWNVTKLWLSSGKKKVVWKWLRSSNSTMPITNYINK